MTKNNTARIIIAVSAAADALTDRDIRALIIEDFSASSMAESMVETLIDDDESPLAPALLRDPELATTLLTALIDTRMTLYAESIVND